MAIDPKLNKLVAALAEATGDGRLQWTETADENAFRLTLPNSMVRVRRFERDLLSDANPSIEVSLMDAKGKLVEEWRVQSRYMLPEDPANSKGNDEFKLVDGLLRAARSSARKSDDLIEEIVRDVRKGRPLGVS